MVPKRRRPVLLLILALMCSAGSAIAGDLTFFIGGSKPGKLNSDIVFAPGRTYRELESGPVWGFRLNTNFVPMFGLEHTLGFSTNYLSPKAIADIGDARGFIYSSNLILSFPPGKAVPYVTAGVGLIRQYGSPNLPVGTKVAFNFGGGLKVPRVFGPLGVRFDLRDYSASGFAGSGRLNILEASAGVLFSF